MPRKYESIWAAIKAADVGVEVPIKVHGTAAKTLRQAVLKEKSLETAIRKKVGLRYAGKLEIREVTEGVHPHGYCIIYFKLTFDGTRI
jgi:hypothetical protein